MKFIEVDKYIIKVDDLFGYEFSCSEQDAANCNSKNQCCCSVYHIETSESNIDTIDSIMHEIIKYCPGLEIDGEYLDIFIDEDAGVYSIEKDDQENCLFSYEHESGARRCSIHTVALEHGVNPTKYKPQTCITWPFMSYEENGKTTLSLDLYSKMPCLRKKKDLDNKICSELSSILVTLIGKELWYNVLSDLVGSG